MNTAAPGELLVDLILGLYETRKPAGEDAPGWDDNLKTELNRRFGRKKELWVPFRTDLANYTNEYFADAFARALRRLLQAEGELEVIAQQGAMSALTEKMAGPGIGSFPQNDVQALLVFVKRIGNWKIGTF